MRLEKSEIRKGMYIELDCPIRTYIRKDAAPRYGEAPSPPDFRTISAELDAARRKLETIVSTVRKNARRG